MSSHESTHPTPGAILELHFGEAGPAAAAIEAHLARCAACRHQRDEVAWAEALLAADEEPPAEGLERVLAAVAGSARTSRARPTWPRAVAPSAAAVAVGLVAIRALGARLLASGFLPDTALAPIAALSGFGLAALVFFAVGSLFTLTVAPLLILEAQARGMRAASR
jgi:hypothetical protein